MTQTNPQHSSVGDEPFICTDGHEHRIGQRYDERRGVGNGPQICLRCGKTLMALIEAERVEAQFAEISNIDFVTKDPEVLRYRDLRRTHLAKELSKLKGQVSVGPNRYSPADVSGHGSDLWPEQQAP